MFSDAYISFEKFSKYAHENIKLLQNFENVDIINQKREALKVTPPNLLHFGELVNQQLEMFDHDHVKNLLGMGIMKDVIIKADGRFGEYSWLLDFIGSTGPMVRKSHDILMRQMMSAEKDDLKRCRSLFDQEVDISNKYRLRVNHCFR